MPVPSPCGVATRPVLTKAMDHPDDSKLAQENGRHPEPEALEKRIWSGPIARWRGKIDARLAFLAPVHDATYMYA